MNTTSSTVISADETDGVGVTRYETPKAVYNPRRRTFRRLVPCRDALAAPRAPTDPFALPEAMATMVTAFAEAYQRAAFDLIDSTVQTYIAGFSRVDVGGPEFRNVQEYVHFLEDYEVTEVEDLQRRAFSDIDW